MCYQLVIQCRSIWFSTRNTVYSPLTLHQRWILILRYRSPSIIFAMSSQLPKYNRHRSNPPHTHPSSQSFPPGPPKTWIEYRDPSQTGSVLSFGCCRRSAGVNIRGHDADRCSCPGCIYCSWWQRICGWRGEVTPADANAASRWSQIHYLGVGTKNAGRINGTGSRFAYIGNWLW